MHRGHGYRLLGDLEKAFKDYSNAIAMCDRDAEAFASRAGVAEASGDIEGAIADFQQAAAMKAQSRQLASSPTGDRAS
ncbi:hypothetical protein QUA70_20800 [Microcoleus sp. LAD1_D5]|uniref:hypothetical protein n=1 Tax=unclassified Microcoleus TaxID=2642155 RepID=UPI002FD26797